MEEKCVKSIKIERDSDTGSHADPIRKHIKYGTSFQATKGIFLEYFNESTVHGFKYIGDQKRSSVERIIWLCALVLSIAMCCHLITNIWEKRNSTPVIVTFNEKLIPVWEIPFPSVTICPEIKTHTNIFNYTKINWKVMYDPQNITQDEQYYWEAIAQTCPAQNSDGGNLYANASDLIKAMLLAAPTLTDTHYNCGWNGFVIDCHRNMQQVFTDEGVCFTFNSMKSNNFRNEYLDAMNYDFRRDSNWNLENGYGMKAGQKAFPFRKIGAGDGLFLTLVDKMQDRDVNCNGFSQRFKVVFHTPGDEPQVAKEFISIPVGQSGLVSIKPKIVKSSEKLRQYDPYRRLCYFQNERYLRYFKLYTQANCELECLSNITLDRCGCVKFSMPRNISHAVCGAKSIECLFTVKEDLLIMKFKQETEPNQLDNSFSCNCLPTCISIQYKADLEHQSSLDIAQHSHASLEDEYLKENPGSRFTQLTINFKEDAFNALKRSELYSTTDFIANSGGLLGLFMGVSILSLVELVYFFTIRLWVNLKKRKEKQQELRNSNKMF